VTHAAVEAADEVRQAPVRVAAGLRQGEAQGGEARSPTSHRPWSACTPRRACGSRPRSRPASRRPATAQVVTHAAVEAADEVRQAPVRVAAGLRQGEAQGSALERLHAEKGVRITSAIPPGLAAACDPQDLDEMGSRT
jgi:predicted transcriptional regulator